MPIKTMANSNKSIDISVTKFIFILNIYSSDVLAKKEAKILFRINNEIITRRNTYRTN